MSKLTGNELRRLRRGLRVTVEQVAAAAGLSRPYLSIIENSGSEGVPEKYADNLLDALDDLAVNCGSAVNTVLQRIRDLKRERQLATIQVPEAGGRG
jgi:transcriptional regulator with XRE-family HTH domain